MADKETCEDLWTNPDRRNYENVNVQQRKTNRLWRLTSSAVSPRSGHDNRVPAL